MHNFSKEKFLPYKAADLYQLVLDIESYPEFIPWCSAAKIISPVHNKHLLSNNCEFIAELTIKYKIFTENYQSRVIGTGSIKEDSEIYKINVEAISGPFAFLRNSWEFNAISNGCYVKFFISFAFRNILLDKLIGQFFSKATIKMMDAFEDRAKKILISL